MNTLTKSNQHESNPTFLSRQGMKRVVLAILLGSSMAMPMLTLAQTRESPTAEKNKSASERKVEAEVVYERAPNGERAIEHAGASSCFALLSLLPRHNTGVFVTYNCFTGGQALGGFRKAFMDHYYPATELQELKLARPVPERVAKCAGEYSSLQRSFTSLTNLAAIISTVNVRVDSDGYLVATGLQDRPIRCLEVAPLLFQEAKG
jgi:Ni/Co efflux regulator RcnB